MPALLVLLLALPIAAAPRFTVAIDAGHGGERHGAVGPHGLREKDLALALARRLAARVERDLKGRAVLIRDTDSDVALADRPARANQVAADLYVSIHLNSMPTARSRKTTRGIETYFLSADASGEGARAVADRENADAGSAAPAAKGDVAAILEDLARMEAHQDSSILAAALHERLVEVTGAQDRGVMQAPFSVLMGARMPAVLCEVGFISHPEEGPQLALPALQDKIARALAQGIADYLKKVARRTAAAP